MESDPEVLSVQRKRDLSLVHVKEHPQDAFLLEGLSELLSISVASVAQLPEPIEAKSEFVVTEGIRNTELLLGGHPNFQFVLSAGVCNYFPVVLAVHEGPVRDHSAEQVVRLKQECVSVVA